MAQSLAFSRPPHHPPDRMTTTSEVSVPLTMEQQVSVTHACASHSGSAYAASILDIYRVVTENPRDVKAYINKETAEGAMFGPFP